jgi:hypothetical protein
MLLTAITYNLKKLLKYQPKRVRSMALAFQPDQHQRAQGPFSAYLPAGWRRKTYVGK